MHHEAYTGLASDGVFAGKPHELFVGGVPDAADAPPFELKAVDEDILVKIQQRYDSVHPRLEALYPDGETLLLFHQKLVQTHVHYSMVFFVSSLTVYFTPKRFFRRTQRLLYRRLVTLPGDQDDVACTIFWCRRRSLLDVVRMYVTTRFPHSLFFCDSGRTRYRRCCRCLFGRAIGHTPLEISLTLRVGHLSTTPFAPFVLVVPRGGPTTRAHTKPTTCEILLSSNNSVLFAVDADPAKRSESIREMNLSVELLREAGTKDWDLPSLFTTTAVLDDDSSDNDSSDDDSSGGDGTSDSEALDTMSPEALPDGPLTENGGGGAENDLRWQPGWFAVFPSELTNPCPLVVGKIVSVDLSGEHGGEVRINWFTPVSRKKCRRSRYGRGVWSQEFLKQGNRLTPDQSTESIKAVCFTFPSLLQSGKLPSGVWAAVEESVPTSSLEEVETDDSDSDGDDVEGEVRAGGCRGEEQSGVARSPTVPPPTRATGPIMPSAAPPAPGVRLTAAHFRPRRGQERAE